MEAVRRHRRRRSSRSHSEWMNILEDMDIPLEEHFRVPPDSNSDRLNIATLFGLYVLQGIPLGLSAAIPLYLQTKDITYSDQAKFSFVQYPFSLKLLWAPLVDAVYSDTFGRRKSWLVPCQYMIGIFLMYLSYNVDSWIGISSHPDVGSLTLYFFLLNFLAATQDIVVDGWALTMLERRNVAYASTCNSVGQSAGYFLGYVLFLALDSPEFCNKFLRSTPQSVGLVTLSGFLFFWGLVFLVATTLILLFKTEQTPRHRGRQLTLVKAYAQLWEIMKLPAVRVYIIILLTSKIGFGACDGITSLKLAEMGVTKEKLAGLAVLAIPLQVALPLLISKYLLGPRPMTLFIQAVPIRLVLSLASTLLVWLAPYSTYDDWRPFLYYLLLTVLYLLIQVPINIMYVANMAFFARISDPAVGGTYMTLLNTVANFGGSWPATVALWFVDILTVKQCLPSKVYCLPWTTGCDAVTCHTKIDGYYIISFICFKLGWFWLVLARNKALSLQTREHAEWAIVRRERGEPGPVHEH